MTILPVYPHLVLCRGRVVRRLLVIKRAAELEPRITGVEHLAALIRRLRSADAPPNGTSCQVRPPSVTDGLQTGTVAEVDKHRVSLVLVLKVGDSSAIIRSSVVLLPVQSTLLCSPWRR